MISNRNLLLQEVPGVLYLEETVPTKILPIIWVQPFPDAKLVWYIYLHVAILITVNVGKYTSSVEHLGFDGKESQS